MTERIFIGVAWPYANGPLHLGHIAGCYLPADIFARYHRLAGHDVLMVSGSDQHGTPIVIRAEDKGMMPEQVANRYHHEFLDSWNRLGISFDLYTTTGTTNHSRIVQDVFNRLQQRGYIRQATMAVVYCPGCRRFLPDRFVEGDCPHCHSPNARGDQCAVCGRVLDPSDLVAPRCRRCGANPEQRDRKHVFLRLSALDDEVQAGRSIGGLMCAESPTRGWSEVSATERSREISRGASRCRSKATRTSASTSGSRP